MRTSAHQRPRPRDRAGRRAQLVRLATQGIFDKGYERFSINDLADAAQLSVGGIYRYISTKSDLLVMACEDIYGGLYEAVEAACAPGLGPEQHLRLAFKAYLDGCASTRDRVLLLYREYRHLPAGAQQRYQQREQRIAHLFVELIESGQRAGAFADLDARTIAQDMVLLGHLPALKGWALPASGQAGLATRQVELVLAALTGPVAAPGLVAGRGRVAPPPRERKPA